MEVCGKEAVLFEATQRNRIIHYNFFEKKESVNMLNIVKNIASEKACLALEGRLDTITAPELEAELRSVLDNTTELVLDFEKLDYISSAGLRVLLSAQKIMSKQGQLQIVHVNETIMEIFEVTGFSDILTIQ